MKRYWNISLLSLIFCALFFTPHVSSAEQTTQKVIPRYSRLMAEGDHQLKLCRTYFDSYRQSREISYLKLADHFCTESIKTYYRCYYHHFSNPKARHNAREAFGSVCDFYNDDIYDMLRHHGLPHFKSRTGADYCQEQ